MSQPILELSRNGVAVRYLSDPKTAQTRSLPPESLTGEAVVRSVAPPLLGPLGAWPADTEKGLSSNTSEIGFLT